MNAKKIIGIMLASAILLSGCSRTVQTESSLPETSQTAEKIVFTEEETVTESSSEETQGKFEFNPHVYSAQLAKTVPQEHWDALYSLCDALRAGETNFKCADDKAYPWATDVTIMCCLFPAAGLP